MRAGLSGHRDPDASSSGELDGPTESASPGRLGALDGHVDGDAQTLGDMDKRGQVRIPFAKLQAGNRRLLPPQPFCQLPLSQMVVRTVPYESVCQGASKCCSLPSSPEFRVPKVPLEDIVKSRQVPESHNIETNDNSSVISGR